MQLYASNLLNIPQQKFSFDHKGISFLAPKIWLNFNANLKSATTTPITHAMKKGILGNVRI